MKFNFKSKSGFTLIELLVVIGILAVLAAIAIPSVAGLIDRANVSADATNANEMTNAIERFTSEYELYLQDIASGRLDTTNLDSAQGRVYNVTGVTDRAGIEALEKDATAGVDTTGKAIYRDTKYPVNAETMQAVVENYMKTSSSTFTPKQSDCHYYYSPDCGLVVCTETEASDVTDLNKLVQSGKDAKGKDLGATTKWIDLTANSSTDNTNNLIDPKLNPSGIIPEGWEIWLPNTPEITIEAGNPFPTEKNVPMLFRNDSLSYHTSDGYSWSLQSAWGYYENIFETINGAPVTYIETGAHDFNTAITKINNIPNTITSLGFAFRTSSITSIVDIPDSVNDITDAFSTTNITTAPKIGSGVTGMDMTFMHCKKLTTVSEIPQNVESMQYTFSGCTALTGTIEINCSPTNYEYCFDDVDFQAQHLTLSGSSSYLDEIGLTGLNYCTNCNGYCSCGTFTH